jgi:hypothetical protein
VLQTITHAVISDDPGLGLGEHRVEQLAEIPQTLARAGVQRGRHGVRVDRQVALRRGRQPLAQPGQAMIGQARQTRLEILQTGVIAQQRALLLAHRVVGTDRALRLAEHRAEQLEQLTHLSGLSDRHIQRLGHRPHINRQVPAGDSLQPRAEIRQTMIVQTLKTRPQLPQGPVRRVSGCGGLPGSAPKQRNRHLAPDLCGDTTGPLARDPVSSS